MGIVPRLLVTPHQSCDDLVALVAVQVRVESPVHDGPLSEILKF